MKIQTSVVVDSLPGINSTTLKNDSLNQFLNSGWIVSQIIPSGNGSILIILEKDI